MILIAFLSPADAGNGPPRTGGIMTPAPDSEASLRREYDGVAAKNTREGYELFIRRHPDDPLADEARAWLKRNAEKK